MNDRQVKFLTAVFDFIYAELDAYASSDAKVDYRDFEFVTLLEKLNCPELIVTGLELDTFMSLAKSIIPTYK